MFFIRYRDTPAGPYTTMSLIPGPTEIDYPEKRLFKMRTTQDGAVVIQRPLRDGRSRKWTWKGYRSFIAPYENQWLVLETLEYRYRIEHALTTKVEVWENVTGVGGFSRVDGSGNKIWTSVKFVQVARTPRKSGGGPVTYDESTIEFVIDDSGYSGF